MIISNTAVSPTYSLSTHTVPARHASIAAASASILGPKRTLIHRRAVPRDPCCPCQLGTAATPPPCVDMGGAVLYPLRVSSTRSGSLGNDMPCRPVRLPTARACVRHPPPDAYLLRLLRRPHPQLCCTINDDGCLASTTPAAPRVAALAAALINGVLRNNGLGVEDRTTFTRASRLKCTR